MVEDSVWSTFPSKNDWFPGWAKRMGELTIESLKVQYGWDNWTIIRPSNIYGINDNFSPDATVISSNIWKLFNVESDTIVCWGDGSARRDFVFGDDVAQASIDVIVKEVRDVINFGCGQSISIKETIETMIDVYYEVTGTKKNIAWDITKPNGDLMRCLSSDKQKYYDILPTTSLSEGLKQTIEVLHNIKRT
jgi:GDP-L-fucose synthase